MNTAAGILFTAAAVIWVAGPIAALALWVSARRERKAAIQARAEQDREVDAEWLALLAATETTPIYDALVCERLEKENWS